MESILSLKWGYFSITHIITLIFAVVGSIALYYAIRNRSQRTQTIVLFLFSMLGPITMLREIIVYAPTFSILRYLPVHLCSFNAILLPILILTKSEFLGNLTPLFSIASGLAVVFNSIQADYSIFSMVFLLYYTSHVMGCAVPFIMWKLGHFRVRGRWIFPCILTFFIAYTVVHFLNVFINTTCELYNITDATGELIWVNYMFSISTQDNPGLGFFWSIIPHEYFYLLSTFPVILIYYLLLNIKSVIKLVKYVIWRIKKGKKALM